MTSMFGFDNKKPLPVHADEETIVVPDPEGKAKALRDLFVVEYLKDRDQTRAAQRCGFEFQAAVEWGRKFMGEPYVARKIDTLSMDRSVSVGDLEDYNKIRIREGLIAEAFYKGPGSSHAGRVAALKILATHYGMIGATGPGAGGVGGGGAQGGVMQVPGTASNIDDWEKQASDSQDALIKHAGSGE